MTTRNRYESPLSSRNASASMQEIWSPHRKFSTWRRLWLELATAERALGLPISQAQIDELAAHQHDIDFDLAAAHEKRVRHDVMAHVHTLGDIAPKAKPIIHLGATSLDITDNTEVLLLRDALQLVAMKLANVVDVFGRFSEQYRSLPTLGFTHYQPAQPTTVGKRAALWTYEFALALEDIEHRIKTLRFRGIKGTTGTQASFLELFNGDHRKVLELERQVASSLGFNPDQIHTVTGQTYPRIVDAQIVSSLAGIAVAISKACNDIRLLANRKEIEEPLEDGQIGSSAMAYKRNPVLCERATGLSRFVISLMTSPYITGATQWLERTLDDSSNRRLALPEPFLAIDGALDIMIHVGAGLMVYPAIIHKNLMDELPFMATENIIMAAVKAGGDRQHLHEVIRVHSRAAGNRVKNEGAPNDLLDRLRADPIFKDINLDAVMNPEQFVGRSPEQVDQLLGDIVNPIRSRFGGKLGYRPELKV